MSQNDQSKASSLEPVQTPNKMEMDDEGNVSMEEQNLPSHVEPKPTPALVKRKKFKDLFQSPSDSLVSPMSRTLSGKTHPLLLKQKPKPKRLNSEETTEKQ